MLPNHRHILPLLDSWTDTHDRLILELEFCESDLAKYISSYGPLDEVAMRRFTRHVLEGLVAIHSRGVIHRDLKPDNILISQHPQRGPVLKIADFGCARLIDSSGAVFSKTWGSLLYSPPDIIMGSCVHTPAIDMWSTGCIIAEMLLGRQLFAGRDCQDQLMRIFRVIGQPPEGAVLAATKHGVREGISLQTGYFSPASWRSVLPGASTHVRAVLDRLLCFDPARRMSASDALAYYFSVHAQPSAGHFSLQAQTAQANQQPPISFIQTHTIVAYQHVQLHATSQSHRMVTPTSASVSPATTAQSALDSSARNTTHHLFPTYQVPSSWR
ncbi:kinase-like domain-containing protein [Auriculariales sp. MPI-PUGE-AT-0066]|nr:kinase-like domain-containing protein [Auriculariales sp. MPI-PUGE-AT-0066]